MTCDLFWWPNLQVWDGEGGGGDRYTYGWFMLVYGRNHHNIVKQLFLQLKKIFKLEMIKLHEKGMLKAETGWKLSFLNS